MIKQQATISKYLPVALHVMAWSVYALLIYNANAPRSSVNKILIYNGPTVLCQAIIFYINFSFLLPRLYKKLGLLTWITANLVLVSVLSISFVYLQYSFLPDSRTFSLKSIGFKAITNLFFLTQAMIIRFSVDWFKQRHLDKELENERLKTELSFLKTQVNPHFFFNTLNNLYGLSLTQSPDTPATILQISSIMRYLLYETSDTLVELTKEIDILESYISLHQLKSKVKNDVTLQIKGDYKNTMIAPLLLLPLVENAFKHGKNPIEFSLTVDRDVIKFTTSNQVKNTGKTSAGGIGLKNLQRRLHLLYPGASTFLTKELDGNYIASLTIQTSQP